MPAIFAESLPGVDQRAADEPDEQRDNRQLDRGGEPASGSVGLGFGHVWLLQVTVHGVWLLQVTAQRSVAATGERNIAPPKDDRSQGVGGKAQQEQDAV